MLALPEKQGKKSPGRQRETDGIKCKRPHMGIPQPLSDEGKAPNGSRD